MNTLKEPMEKEEGAYSDGSQKSVILQTVSEQKLLDLAPMIFEVLQGSLNLKLEQKQVFYESTILYVTKQVDNEICWVLIAVSGVLNWTVSNCSRPAVAFTVCVQRPPMQKEFSLETICINHIFYKEC